MLKICWITPGHLCNSPRLIKEVSTLYKLGYETVVIASQYVPLLYSEDQKFIDKHPNCRVKVIKWSTLSFKEKINRFKTAILFKAIALINNLFNIKVEIEILINRHYRWQLKQAIAEKADLYIAHNAGALAVAANAAMQTNCKFAFDAEDFHSGETHSKTILETITNLEKKYLHEASYITFSSKYIADAYFNKYALVNNSDIILNTTLKSIRKGSYSEPRKNTLKLVWFSQTVGTDRGLDQIIEAINLINTGIIDFDIIGFCSPETEFSLKNLLNNKTHSLSFLPFLPDDLLREKLRNYDIGIASEPVKDLNNNLALSNKLFYYLNAGLAILASDTLAQKDFVQNLNKEAGAVYKNKDIDHIKCILINWLQKEHLLKNHKENAYQLGQEIFNWDTEQKKFINIIENVC